MDKIFVMSDIHGMYEEFEEALRFWDSSNEHLVILGDLIDRGPDSLKVVRKAMELKERYENVHVLAGNHDSMLQEFVDYPLQSDIYIDHNGGLATIQSFMPHADGGTNLTEAAEYIKTHYEAELTFLKELPLYKIIGTILFTHAGFDTARERWQDTSDEDFVWIREHYLRENRSGYVNVFGHTPTTNIHPDMSTKNRHAIWVSEDKKYIAIDGACAYGGQLNAVTLSTNGVVLSVLEITKADKSWVEKRSKQIFEEEKFKAIDKENDYAFQALAFLGEASQKLSIARTILKNNDVSVPNKQMDELLELQSQVHAFSDYVRSIK